MELTPKFVQTLMQSAEPIDGTKKYKCQNCHRPNLKAEHVAVISHSEAYCIFCTKGA